MFSYIYAGNRSGINYATAAKTQDDINALALDHILNMLQQERLVAPVGKEAQKVFDALAAKDVTQAISAWNVYATLLLQATIACHKIEPISIVDDGK